MQEEIIYNGEKFDTSLVMETTADQIKEALKGSSLTVQGEITVDAVLGMLEGRSSAGIDIKNLLSEICDKIYPDETERSQKVRFFMNNMKKDNFQFCRTYWFIDGIGSGGIELQSILNPKPIPYTYPFPEPEPEPDPFPEPDPQPWPGPEEGNIWKTYFPKEPSDSQSSEDEQEIADTFEEPEEAPSDTSQSDVSYCFDKSVLPSNLIEAQHYYENITDRINDITNDENGMYYESQNNNIICEGTDITINENISVTIMLNREARVHEGTCFIVSNTGRAVIVGKLTKDSEKPSGYFIEASSENIDFDALRQTIQYQVIWFDDMFNPFGGSIKLKFMPMKRSSTTLCIDFGTSNTTAGISENGAAKLVRFFDLTKENLPATHLCPTLVYVKKIHKKDEYSDEAIKVEYLFGYAAKKLLIESDYTPEGTMFFEIKRWILSPEEYEEITDGLVEAKIKRKEVLKAYLKYVLEAAERDLRCHFYKMHFTAPVKLKGIFISFLREHVFTEAEGYEIVGANDSVDEGLAIVYDYISREIIRNDREKKGEDTATHNEKIIIVDCGGGTTDLVNCDYSYRRTDVGYQFDHKSQFTSGNSNFGGNNLTYRIFQLLKIKLADYYVSREKNQNTIRITNIDTLVVSNPEVVLDMIDNSIKEKKPITCYEKLDQKSRESEAILPTDFNGDSDFAKGSKTHKLTKRNFYYLWQLAEEIKIQFFTKTDIVSICLDAERNSLILINKVNMYFYIANPNKSSNGKSLISTRELSDDEEMPNIEINTKEINTLLRPDIYYLLATISNFEQSEFDKIMFSGQSCKINLFRDLLKEFVPGRKLRTAGSAEISTYDTVNSDQLKLLCVRGSIAYMRDRSAAIINAFARPVNQKLIYKVVLSRGGEGIMTKNLFSGADFKELDGKKQAKRFPIAQYAAAEDVYVQIRVYTTSGLEELKNTITVPICSEIGPDSKKIDLELKKDGSPSLEKHILENSYYQLDQYIVTPEQSEQDEFDGEDPAGSQEQKYVVKELIREIQEIPVQKGHPKVLVFATPNCEGYGFLLYQIVKSLDDYGREQYYQTSFTQYTFESGVLSKTFFNGRNCVLKQGKGVQDNA